MHIFELFRAPIQAAVGQLSLREPPPERRHVDDVQSIQNRERRRAHPHCKENKRNASRFAVKINGQKRGATLRGVALGTGHASEAAVEVPARGEVGDCAGAVEPVERAEER
jgi:hypothetical protein